MTDSFTQGTGRAPAFPGFASPVLAALAGSCMAVGTTAWLGAEWLRQSVVGLPAGAWVILLATAGTAALRHLRRRGELGAASFAAWTAPSVGASAPRSAPMTTPVAPGGVRLFLASDDPDDASEAGPAPSAPIAASVPATPTVGDHAGRLGRSAWSSVSRAARAAGLGEAVERVEGGLGAWIDRARGRQGALRIGIDASPDLGAALTRAPGALPIAWARVPRGGDDQADLARHRLDALVRQPDHGPVRIVTPELPGKDAAWFDWSEQPPLAYASVFPARIDPCRITLSDGEDAGHAPELLRGLVEAAAALSRTPARLDLADRISGRRILPDPGPHGAPGEGVLLRLLELVVSSERARAHTHAARTGARVVGAWACTSDGWIDMATRRRGVEVAGALLPDDPAALLRLAAVRFADTDDERAFDAMLRAYRALRDASAEVVGDPLAFLQSEIEHGLPGPMTLGRVASGIGLLCATTPPDRLSLVRDDLLDDMRYSGWLVGRDQDRAVLIEVFRRLESGTERGRSAAAA